GECSSMESLQKRPRRNCSKSLTTLGKGSALEIPGLTRGDPGRRRATYDGSVGTIRKEARREPVRRAPPAEHPLSVLVLRSYAAQRRRTTDAAAGHDRRLSGQVPSGAVDHQGLLPRGL